MTQLSDFHFVELKDWSERKHQLIEKYLDGATRILGKLDAVYYVDGFAGRGTYGRNPQETEAGSPVRAAQLARKYKEEQRTYSLSCINVESKKEHFSELDEVTRAYSDVVTNLCGPFASQVTRILQIVGDKPVICFLDPFGIDGMDMSAVKQLIRRRGITDFWIRFETGEVRRRDGFYQNNAPGADKNFDILRRVYGIHNDDYLHTQLHGQTPEKRKQNALLLYQKLLTAEFESARGTGYSAAYRIGSLEGEHKYHLVFATANNKGLILASNIVYDIEENYQREVEWYRQNRTGQMSLFTQFEPSKEDILKEKVAVIRPLIQNTWTRQEASRRDIHADLINRYGWFGRLKGTHITAALRTLVEDSSAQASGILSDDKTIFRFK